MKLYLNGRRVIGDDMVMVGGKGRAAGGPSEIKFNPTFLTQSEDILQYQD